MRATALRSVRSCSMVLGGMFCCLWACSGSPGGLPPSGLFEATVPLHIDAVTPDTAYTLSQATISIYGGPFAVGAQVEVGGVPAGEVSVRSSSVLTAKLPKWTRQVGLTQVSVQNPDGERASASGLFTFAGGQLGFPAPFLPATSRELTGALTTADFNRDGQDDVAFAVGGENSIAVFVSNGQGGFSPTPHFIVGSTPSALVAADLNRDGNVDLVVANQGSSDISVLLGNGQGGFVATRFPAGPSPADLAVADFNEDAQLDLVVSNPTTASVSVILGDGRGRFSAPTAFATEDGARALATADIDADGHIDVLVASPSTNRLALLSGTGTGGLRSTRKLTTHSQPIAVAVADLNRDGSPDIAVACSTDKTIDLWFGDTTGELTAGISQTLAVTPSALRAGDLDRDGVTDLLVLQGAAMNQSVLALLGDGHGGFGAKTFELLPLSCAGLAVSDLDGDGWLDIVTIRLLGAQLLLNDGAGALSTRPPKSQLKFYDSPADAAAYPMAGLDLDHDGKLDLLTASVTPAVLVALSGDGTGKLALRYTLGPATDFAVGDLSGDGIPDVITCAGGSSLGRIYTLGRAGTPLSAIPRTSCSRGIAIGNFMGDASPDIAYVLAGVSEPTIVAGQVNELGAYDRQLTPVSTSYPGYSLLAGDFNGDGRSDLVWNNNQYPIGVTMLYGNGRGGFEQRSLCSNYYAISQAVGDLNRDGFDDVVTSGWEGFVPISAGQRRQGLTCGSLAQFSTTTLRQDPAQVLLADVNGDRRLDLVVGSGYEDQIFSIYYGDGKGGFPSVAHFASLGWLGTAGDFDGDGRSDLVLGPLGTMPTVLLNSAP